MRIFWTEKAFEEEKALWLAKYKYRDAVLNLIESIYEVKYSNLNGDEVMTILQDHDDKIHWESYERGIKAGIRAAFQGMCKSGVMEQGTAEKFIEDMTAHTQKKIEEARAKVHKELEENDGQKSE